MNQSNADHAAEAAELAAEADKHLRRVLVAIDDLIVQEWGEWSSAKSPKIVRRAREALTQARRYLEITRDCHLAPLNEAARLEGDRRHGRHAIAANKNGNT